MSTWWKQLAGDTADFAVSLEFHADPHKGGATPDEALSWGAFEIWVDGSNLCAHTEEGEIVLGAHWYLLPLMEWLVANWDPLLHEERLPTEDRAEDAWVALRSTCFPPPRLEDAAARRWEDAWHRWWRRHSLQSCRQGGLFPDLVIRRWRELVEISWGRSDLPGAPRDFRYLEPRGVARKRPQIVAEAIHDVLRPAVTELLKRCESPRLSKLAEDVEGLREHRDEERLVWLSGLRSSFQPATQTWGHIVEVVRQAAGDVGGAVEEILGSHRDRQPLVLTGSPHANLIFGSVSPSIGEQDVLKLTRELVGLFTETGCDAPIEERARSLALASSMSPREEGYELAEDFLEEIGLPPESTPIERILADLGVGIRDIELDDPQIRGVSIAGPHHRPTVLVNRRDPRNGSEAGRRFTLAHELCHLLHDRDQGARLALASGPWAPWGLEQRADAFAAMLLMPLELLRRSIAGLSQSGMSQEEIREIAKRLGTSRTVTTYHLGNLGFLPPEWHSEVMDHP